MPIVVPGTALYDEYIKPFALSLGFEDRFALPDMDEFASSVLGSGGARPAFTEGSSILSAYGNQLQLAAASTNMGLPISAGIWDGAEGLIKLLPDGLREEFSDLLFQATGIGDAVYDLMDTEAVRKIREALKKLIEPAIEVVTDVLQVATSWIPIVGAFVKFTIALIQLSRNLQLGSNRDLADRTFKMRKFSPEADLEFSNWMLDSMLGNTHGIGPKDLTGMFHPMSNKLAEISYVEGTEGVGKQNIRHFLPHRSIDHAMDNGWYGMIPGEPFADAGWYISWSTHSRDGTKPWGPSYLPSGSNLGDKVWGMIVQTGSPMMFTVNARPLKDAWVDWLFALRYRLQQIINSENWEQGADFVNGAMRDVYGWSTMKVGDALPTGSAFDDKYDAFGLGDCTPIKHLESLEKQQMSALDHSLVCAYVDETYPSIKFNPSLRNKWESNRMLLKQHNDRCRVDVNSIPDKAYRDAMVYALQGCGPQNLVHGGPTQIAGVFKPISDNPVEKAPAQGRLSKGLGFEKEITGEGSTGAAGLLLGAAVLGLLAFNKK
jgi:hypothetical protein